VVLAEFGKQQFEDHGPEHRWKYLEKRKHNVLHISKMKKQKITFL
jgi:hypothetical protein